MNITKCLNFLRDKSGNVAIIFAVSLFPVLFSVGISVDYSLISQVKSRLQETADSAALYAIKGLRDGGYDEEDIDDLAYNMVVSNYDLNTSTVEIKHDTVADTLSVHLKTIYTPAFLKAFKYDEISITAFSQIEYRLGNEAIKCFIALDKSAFNALNLVGNSIIGANQCAIHVNSSSNDAVDLNGSDSYIKAQEICIVGEVDSGLNRISPPPKDCSVISDPFDNVDLPVVGNCDHHDFRKNNSGSVYPGVYCGGLTIGGSASVTFQPGLYIIKDGEFSAGGESFLSGDGVTFYLTGDVIGLNCSGGSKFDLTAMSTGKLAGFIFYFDPNSPIAPVASEFSGNSSTYFEGILYFGGHDVVINGEGSINTTSPFSIIVGDTIKMNGDATITFNVEASKTNLVAPDELYYRNVNARITQ